MELGSRFKRFIANILDGLVLHGASAVLVFLLAAFNFGLNKEDLSDCIFIILSLIYFTAFEQSKCQATLGKMVFKLYVADTAGKRISPWRALARSVLAFWAPWLPLVGILVMVLMSSEIIAAANILDTEAVSGIKRLELGEYSDLAFILQLLAIAHPVITCSLLVSFVLLPLVWFVPILFKSRRGMYERISKTVVLSR